MAEVVITYRVSAFESTCTTVHHQAIIYFNVFIECHQTVVHGYTLHTSRPTVLEHRYHSKCFLVCSFSRSADMKPDTMHWQSIIVFLTSSLFFFYCSYDID